MKQILILAVAASLVLQGCNDSSTPETAPETDSAWLVGAWAPWGNCESGEGWTISETGEYYAEGEDGNWTYEDGQLIVFDREIIVDGFTNERTLLDGTVRLTLSNIGSNQFTTDGDEVTWMHCGSSEGGEGSFPSECYETPTQPGTNFEGKLTLQTFPGPPNFESIASGDRPIEALILELPEPICASDGGEFADPSETFDTIHVVSSDDATRQQLSAMVGQNIRLSGEAFAAHNSNHYAPLVLMVQPLSGP